MNTNGQLVSSYDKANINISVTIISDQDTYKSGAALHRQHVISADDTDNEQNSLNNLLTRTQLPLKRSGSYLELWPLGPAALSPPRKRRERRRAASMTPRRRRQGGQGWDISDCQGSPTSCFISNILLRRQFLGS